jgi:hypothetical protein
VIAASAIRLPDGRIFAGKRHTDAYLAAQTILTSTGPLCGEDGFITSALEFLNRGEAYKYAKKSEQFRRGDTGFHKKELYSEDLWQEAVK